MPGEFSNHTEFSILESYLLPPSPLPTIITYSSFIKLVPAKYVNDSSYSGLLKRLYRDLQLQRDLDVETVRANVERECARGPTLKAVLARQIVKEDGHNNLAERPSSRKRKRDTAKPGHGRKHVEEDATDESSDSASRMHDNKESDDDNYDDDVVLMDADDELQHESAAEHAFTHHHLNAYATLQALPTSISRKSVSKRLLTTRNLLEAMENAGDSLERENKKLEDECRRRLTEIKETVGNLSDLRYGTLGNKAQEGTDKILDLTEELYELRRILATKMSGSSTSVQASTAG